MGSIRCQEQHKRLPSLGGNVTHRFAWSETVSIWLFLEAFGRVWWNTHRRGLAESPPVGGEKSNKHPGDAGSTTHSCLLTLQEPTPS